MANLYKVWISSQLYQAVTGRVVDKNAVAKISEELVKEINKLSNGKVYFWKDSTGYINIGYEKYRDAKNVLEKQIEKVVKSRVEKGNFEEKGEVLDVGVIDINDIDLNNFKQKFEEECRKLEEEKRKQEEKERIKEAMKQIVNEKGLRAEFYANSMRVKIGFNKGNVFKVIREQVFDYNEDDLKKLESLNETEILKEYLSKLEQENEELKKKLEKRKEEIIKELYESGKTITVADKCQKELKVVSVDDYY